MTAETVTPIFQCHEFRRSDQHSRRMKPDEILWAGTKLELNASHWHRMEALRRWALKRTKRLTAGKAFAYQRPVFYIDRDPRYRETIIRVEWHYAPISRPDGEVWIVPEIGKERIPT